MTIACTFPGKFGDLLWALPTVRAISESAGEPVTLIVSQYLAPIAPLIEQQPYIHEVVVRENWIVQMTAPISPRFPPGPFPEADKIIHLGYEGWPTLPLPYDIERIGRAQTVAQFPWKHYDYHYKPWKFDLERPWIIAERYNDNPPDGVIAGFTDEHFELKVGLCTLLLDYFPGLCCVQAPLSRWDKEMDYFALIGDWCFTASEIQEAKVFLGCCSAMHVLACALGKTTVVMEPSEHRWNPIFWPAIDRIHKVLGNDGKPTFDARHVRDAIQKFL